MLLNGGVLKIFVKKGSKFKYHWQMKNILDRFWTIFLNFFSKKCWDSIFSFLGRLRARAVHGVSSIINK